VSAALNLRCSALPLAFRCAAAIRPGQVTLNSANEAADAGTATHKVLEPLPRTDQIDWDGIPEIAKRFGADPKEVRILSALGVKLWNQVKESFRGALTEVELKYEVAPAVWLTGHADLLAISQRAMRVGDWKSGRLDSDHSHQFKGYASLALLSSEDIEEATGTGLWIRDQEAENYTLTRRDAQLWLDEVVTKIVNWDGVYRPGKHCGLCPRNHECEAANALVRRDISVIADKSLVARVETDLAHMSDAEKVEILLKADLVSDYAARVRDAIRAHVLKNGDVVANGVRLTIARENRTDIDPLKAWPLLEAAGFDDKDFARSMTLKKSAIEDVVAEKAGKGNGASAKRELAAKLEQAGAISVRTVEKLNIKRAS
jgi:hypothetical protein